MSADPLISVRSLSKHFRTFERREGIVGGLINLFHREYRIVKAVDNITCSIGQGDMAGYIGPNGAGKPTAIKMLTGILVPTSGEIRSNGFVPWRQRAAYVKTIGVVFGQRTQLWWDIAVIESFKLLRRIYDVSQRDFDERMELFNQVLGLRDYLHTPVRKLSLGERMRCELARALRDFEELLAHAPQGKSLRLERLDEMTCRIRFDRSRISTSDLIRQILAAVEVRDLLIEDEPIEEIVKRIYAGEAFGKTEAGATVRGSR